MVSAAWDGAVVGAVGDGAVAGDGEDAGVAVGDGVLAGASAGVLSGPGRPTGTARGGATTILRPPTSTRTRSDFKNGRGKHAWEGHGFQPCRPSRE
jgi:hypothetical protein